MQNKDNQGVVSTNRLTILKSIIEKEFINYLKKVVYINQEKPEQIVEFLNLIKVELVKHCTYRNFNAFNINVLRLTNETVLKTPSLRSFYFEMYSTLSLNLLLDYDVKAETYLKLLFSALLKPPCSYLLPTEDQLNIGLHGEDFKDLSKSLDIRQKEVNTFLEANPWYYTFILISYCSSDLIEHITTLSSVGKPK